MVTERLDAAGLVTVVDGFVSGELQASLLELLSRPIWAYGWKSSKTTNGFGFWHAHFAGGGKDCREACEDELAARLDCAPVQQLWHLLKQGPLAGHEPLRVYANAHTYGTEGYTHRDNSDKENYFTTVYYAHPEWTANWAGELVFYNDEKSEIVTSVYPKPGRLVSFHGSVFHAARAPSRDCAALRICLVIKTQRAACSAKNATCSGSALSEMQG